MSEPKILTIDRASWYRGQGGQASMLLRSDGLKCCLGFDALARVLAPDQIELVGDPSEAIDPPESYREAMIDEDSPANLKMAVLHAIEHNDNQQLDEIERERLIREDLIALGWDDVIFVGESFNAEHPSPR